MTLKQYKLSDGTVRAFVAPNWTLEFSLQKSNSFRTLFEESFKIVHPNAGKENLEYEVAKKLLNKGLKKQEIAYLMAHAIQSNLSKENDLLLVDDDHASQYLINGIKHACGI